MSETEGAMACPVCGYAQCTVKLSKGRGYAYAHCDECGTQMYTRSRHASAQLCRRAGLGADPAPAPAPEPAPAPAPAKKKNAGWEI